MNKTKELFKEIKNLKKEIEGLKFLNDIEKLTTPKLGFDFDKEGFII